MTTRQYKILSIWKNSELPIIEDLLCSQYFIILKRIFIIEIDTYGKKKNTQNGRVHDEEQHLLALLSPSQSILQK